MPLLSASSETLNAAFKTSFDRASTQVPMADWLASGCSTLTPAGPSTFNAGMSCFSTAVTVCAPACMHAWWPRVQMPAK